MPKLRSQSNVVKDVSFNEYLKKDLKLVGFLHSCKTVSFTLEWKKNLPGGLLGKSGRITVDVTVTDASKHKT